MLPLKLVNPVGKTLKLANYCILLLFTSRAIIHISLCDSPPELTINNFIPRQRTVSKAFSRECAANRNSSSFWLRLRRKHTNKQLADQPSQARQPYTATIIMLHAKKKCVVAALQRSYICTFSSLIHIYPYIAKIKFIQFS